MSFWGASIPSREMVQNQRYAKTLTTFLLGRTGQLTTSSAHVLGTAPLEYVYNSCGRLAATKLGPWNTAVGVEHPPKRLTQNRYTIADVDIYMKPETSIMTDYLIAEHYKDSMADWIRIVVVNPTGPIIALNPADGAAIELSDYINERLVNEVNFKVLDKETRNFIIQSNGVMFNVEVNGLILWITYRKFKPYTNVYGPVFAHNDWVGRAAIAYRLGSDWREVLGSLKKLRTRKVDMMEIGYYGCNLTDWDIDENMARFSESVEISIYSWKHTLECYIKLTTKNCEYWMISLRPIPVVQEKLICAEFLLNNVFRDKEDDWKLLDITPAHRYAYHTLIADLGIMYTGYISSALRRYSKMGDAIADLYDTLYNEVRWFTSPNYNHDHTIKAATVDYEKIVMLWSAGEWTALEVGSMLSLNNNNVMLSWIRLTQGDQLTDVGLQAYFKKYDTHVTQYLRDISAITQLSYNHIEKVFKDELPFDRKRALQMLDYAYQDSDFPEEYVMMEDSQLVKNKE